LVLTGDNVARECRDSVAATRVNAKDWTLKAKVKDRTFNTENYRSKGLLQ